MIGAIRTWGQKLFSGAGNPLLQNLNKDMRAREGVPVKRPEALKFPPFARTITVIASTVAKYITTASVYPREGRESVSEDGKRLERALWGSLDNGQHSSFEKLQADIADYLIEGYSLNLVKRQSMDRRYPLFLLPCMGNMVLQKKDGVPLYIIGGKYYTASDVVSVTFRDLYQEKQTMGFQTFMKQPRPVPSNLEALKNPLNTGIAIWNALEAYFGRRFAMYLVDQINFEDDMSETVRDQYYGRLDDALRNNMPMIQGKKGELMPPGEIGAIASVLDTLRQAVHTIHTYYGLSPLMMGTSTVERGAGLGRISDIDFSYCFEIHLKKFLHAYQRSFLAIGEMLVPNRIANFVGGDNIAQILQTLRPDPGQNVQPLASDHEIRKHILGMPYDPEYVDRMPLMLPMPNESEEQPEMQVVGDIGDGVEDWREHSNIIAL